jgi:hypothetical protein
VGGHQVRRGTEVVGFQNNPVVAEEKRKRKKKKRKGAAAHTTCGEHPDSCALTKVVQGGDATRGAGQELLRKCFCHLHFSSPLHKWKGET